MAKQVKNTLSIYLIKEEFDSDEVIVKEYENQQSEDIEGVGTIYYGLSNIFQPKWLTKFFKNVFNNTNQSGSLKIYSSSAKAVLLVKVDNRYFAICFGYGRTILNQDTYEERFGLKVALNTIDSEKIKIINKLNLSALARFTDEQFSGGGNISAFGLDVEQDMMRGVSGISNVEDFGTTIVGKDSLKISVPIDVSNIKPFLKRCFTHYKEKKYRKDFGWVDNMAMTKDKSIINKLNNMVLDDFKSHNLQKLWMSVPEIIDWGLIDEFKSSYGSLGFDIELSTFRNLFSDSQMQELSLDALMGAKINGIGTGSGTSEYNWKVFNCFYSEQIFNEKIYVLSNGKWFLIGQDFARNIVKRYKLILRNSIDLNLPSCEQSDSEGEYNIKTASRSNIFLMDKVPIYHGAKNQWGEFCDLFTSDKKIIHVKKYGSSQLFSHLFSQGTFSAELLCNDMVYRKKVNSHLPNEFKLSENIRMFDNHNYTVVFAIISGNKKELDIPFFSKVNLQRAYDKITRLGYKVSLNKILKVNNN